MKDLRSLLEEADPLRRESELSETDAARMRAVVVSTARQPVKSSPFWSGAFAVAAAAMLMLIAGTLGERRLANRAAVSGTEPAIVQTASGERRQLQFSTPGGTRIIWTLDPGFQLREVKP
jgi:hypothetical protein